MAACSRRDFLRAGAALACGLAVAPGADAAQDGIAIGIFTDSHYADLAPRGTRHYRDSAAKLAQFVQAMDEAKPDFCVVLGDYTDQAGGAEQKAADLKRIDAIYRRSQAPRHYVLGNHDLDVFTKEQFVAGTGMPAPHYSFEAGPFHAIVLDANYRKDLSPYRAGNFDWTQAYIPPAEQRWLEADLAKADRKTLVFVHQCLDDEKGAHGVKNAPEVRRILEESGKVLAVFQGHNHRGAYRAIHDIPYFTMRAMVEGQGLANNAFALARVTAAGSVQIRGFGRQPSWPQ